jgi:serine phosphatase RsbU (regulator of sigma subunit)
VIKLWLRRFGARTLLALVALTGSAVLYVKTRAVDFAAHAELVEALRRTQQLNAVLQHQVLASRFGLLNEYDALSRTQGELALAVADLSARFAHLSYGDAETRAALARLLALRARRAQDVEQFKTQNAVLKNSLYYLPTAGDGVLAAQAGGTLTKGLAEHVHGIVQDTLLLNLLASDDLRGRLDTALGSSAAFSTSLSKELASQYGLFAQHARTVRRQQELVDPLIALITSAEFERVAIELSAAYTRSFERAVRSANMYRIALYVSVLVLLLLVMVIGLKLRELYANLGRMVKERTEQLERALAELWGEMELAKKIQTALVPEHPKLKGCDVAAVMKPADQVGGDYYDVLSVDGNEWILIGDVSGHGIPAGLVMMMCQTAVHTVLELDPKIAPDKLLAIVNRALTQNIQRLGEDKYMTINAMFRRPDGCFQYSGMHQDILIYRAKSATVEEIKAEGICLGLAPHIEDLLVSGSFALEEGDVLLLYTDGITEATRDGRMLDADGLKQILRELGSQSADQIVAGVLARLSDYAISDDVTALAIKQLAS